MIRRTLLGLTLLSLSSLPAFATNEESVLLTPEQVQEEAQIAARKKATAEANRLLELAMQRAKAKAAAAALAQKKAKAKALKAAQKAKQARLAILKQTKPVIIVGAGIAGLSAADNLSKHGLNDFVILEASHTIGGRVKTLRFNKNGWQGETIEAGATTIHGKSPSNPLTALARKAKLRGHATDPDNIKRYDYNGAALSEAVIQRDEHHFASFMGHLQTMQKPQEEQASVGDLLFRYLSKTSLSASEVRGLLFNVNTEIEQQYAQDIRKLSLPYFDSDKTYFGPEWVINNGFDKLATTLAHPFKHKINTGVVITSIDYTHPEHIRLSDNQGRKYYARKVLLTVPISVLKRHISFKPALPGDKLSALSHMSMGIKNQLWLKFPKVFWDKNAEQIQYQPKAFKDNNGFVNKGQNTVFINRYKQTGQAILVAITAGDYGQYMESLSDKATTRRLMKTLKKIYGQAIPQPIAHYYSRWGKNPLAYGSYSSQLPGADKTQNPHQQLAKPVENRLFFAGEATSYNFSGTVHGAYLSGQQQAKQLLLSKARPVHRNVKTWVGNLQSSIRSTLKKVI